MLIVLIATAAQRRWEAGRRSLRLLAWAALPVLVLAAFVASPPSSRNTKELCELGLVARLFLRSCDDASINMEQHARPPLSKSHSTRHPALVGPSALPTSYDGRQSLKDFTSSEEVPLFYSFDMSTQENYGVENKEFYGPYKDIRAELDYDYHGELGVQKKDALCLDCSHLVCTSLPRRQLLAETARISGQDRAEAFGRNDDTRHAKWTRLQDAGGAVDRVHCRSHGECIV